MRIYALLAFRFTECMHFYAISEGWEIGPKSPFTCPTACLARPAKQILSLFTLFRASFAIFCKACKADFVAIYAIPVLFCHIWKSLQSRFCRYVRYSGALLPYLAKLAKQILSLFTLFRASFAIFGKGCKADFVAIYAIPGLFCQIWQSLQSRFCRYLRYSGPLLPYLVKLAKHILSLCALFRASFAIVGKACKAEFVAIYLVPGLFCHSWQSLQSRICRYLPGSGPLLP